MPFTNQDKKQLFIDGRVYILSQVCKLLYITFFYVKAKRCRPKYTSRSLSVAVFQMGMSFMYICFVFYVHLF